MREGGEIPRPAKRRHLTPRDDQIPPALNRVQILQAVNDADGDIKVTDAMEVESGSAASSVDIDEEGRVSPAADPTQLLSGAEPVDWIPPSPVPQTPRFIAKATAAPRPVTAPADENDPPATPSPTLSATSSPSRLETPTMLVRPQLNTLAFASVGSSGGGASGLVPPSSPAGLSRLPKPKFGGAVAPASALGKQLRVDSAGSSSTQLQ
ncbi:hypothetical protein BC828DRAFT_390249 [Blastocladiella britannica]|nr:hypothetical protein BC828DRAFT_390249 [Blastocladiella britannica]